MLTHDEHGNNYACQKNCCALVHTHSAASLTVDPCCRTDAIYAIYAIYNKKVKIYTVYINII